MVIRKYCEDEGFELLDKHLYQDVMSGARDDRPQLQELLAAARRREFQHVVVNDLTRFGRSAQDLLAHTKILRKCRIQFHSKKNKVDTSTPEGKFFFTVLAAMAEFELELIKVRMAEVKLTKLRQRKIILGLVGYGYRWNDETQGLEIIEKEKENYLRLVREYLDLEKSSLDDVALAMKNEGILTRFGHNWTSGTIRNTFRNTIHKGITTIKLTEEITDENGNKTRRIVEEVPFTCDPIITPERWDKLQAKLESGRKERGGRPVTGCDRFILRDLLQCGICGAKLVPKYYTSKLKNGGLLESLYYACQYRHLSKKRLETYGKERCLLPHIPARNLDTLISSLILFHLANDVNEGEDIDESPSKYYSALVSDQVFEDKATEYDKNLVNQKEQLDRKKRGLRNLKQSREEPNFKDFANFNKEVAEYLEEIDKIDRRIAELTKLRKENETLRVQQEELREFLKSKQIMEIHEKLLELSNEEMYRLLKGLLDGKVIITPPSPDAPMSSKIGLDLKKWVSFKMRPNIAILLDVLGIEVPGDDDPDDPNGNGNNSSRYGNISG